MNDSMYAGLVEATRLAREGRVAEATALIQRTLGRRQVHPSTPTDRGSATGPIEATFQVTVEPKMVLEAAAPEASSTVTEPTTKAQAEPTTKAQVVPPIVAKLAARARRVRAGRDFARPDLMSPGSLLRPGILPVRPEGVRVRRPVREDAVAPAAGRWLEGTHTNEAGTRTYQLYVPSGYQGKAMPLIVMLHGCTQNPDDFAAGTGMNFLAEEDGFLAVYPSQAASANPSKCWNWFQAGDQGRDQGEPALIAGITRQVLAEYHNDAGRVYVAGLSAGGAMAAIMAATYPDLYAAVGVHSGLAPGSAHDLPSAFQAMKGGGRVGRAGAGRVIPLILFQGDSDLTVHPSNADQLVQQWTAAEPSSTGGSAPSPKVRQGRAAGGRNYTCALYHDAHGRSVVEQWTVHGASHAWSGGRPDGSYTDPDGPDASRELVRFFREHPRG